MPWSVELWRNDKYLTTIRPKRGKSDYPVDVGRKHVCIKRDLDERDRYISRKAARVYYTQDNKKAPQLMIRMLQEGRTIEVCNSEVTATLKADEVTAVENGCTVYFESDDMNKSLTFKYDMQDTLSQVTDVEDETDVDTDTQSSERRMKIHRIQEEEDNFATDL